MLSDNKVWTRKYMGEARICSNTWIYLQNLRNLRNLIPCILSHILRTKENIKEQLFYRAAEIEQQFHNNYTPTLVCQESPYLSVLFVLIKCMEATVILWLRCGFRAKKGDAGREGRKEDSGRGEIQGAGACSPPPPGPRAPPQRPSGGGLARLGGTHGATSESQAAPLRLSVLDYKTRWHPFARVEQGLGKRPINGVSRGSRGRGALNPNGCSAPRSP